MKQTKPRRSPRIHDDIDRRVSISFPTVCNSFNVKTLLLLFPAFFLLNEIWCHRNFECNCYMWWIFICNKTHQVHGRCSVNAACWIISIIGRLPRSSGFFSQLLLWYTGKRTQSTKMPPSEHRQAFCSESFPKGYFQRNDARNISLGFLPMIAVIVSWEKVFSNVTYKKNDENSHSHIYFLWNNTTKPTSVGPHQYFYWWS